MFPVEKFCFNIAMAKKTKNTCQPHINSFSSFQSALLNSILPKYRCSSVAPKYRCTEVLLYRSIAVAVLHRSIALAVLHRSIAVPKYRCSSVANEFPEPSDK